MFYVPLGLSAEALLKLFESVASHAGESVKLPRKRNTRGREYGRTQYHLAALNVQIDSKSMPLGFKWPGKEPDPDVACDHHDCQSPEEEGACIVVNRMACGHAFHETCVNQVESGCPVCCPLLKAEVNKLACSWNIGLVSKRHCDEEEGSSEEISGMATEDNDQDTLPQNGQGIAYYKCPAFANSIKQRASAINIEKPKFQNKKASRST